jgi:uncharacterized protein (TIRG00374 family)
MRMRTLRPWLVGGGALALLILVWALGADSVVAALRHVGPWEFALICVLHGLNVAVDAGAWRFALPPDRAPFHRLLAARFAGDAVNILSALASVGGEAVKVWVLRRDIPYAESVPSLIISKTAEVVAQALLLALGIVLASTAEVVPASLRAAMVSLLVVEVLAALGFLGVQLAGVVARAGRVLDWTGLDGTQHARQLDESLRGFYRREWPRFLVSVGLYFVGWLIAVAQAWVVLHSLELPASLVTATIVEALWSAVRFATFYVPASLGTLEGANAGAFRAFHWGASAGLAFTLIRRACQVVWIGVGVIILVAMRPTREPAGVEPVASPVGGERQAT